MNGVVLTGSSGALGRRVTALLAASPRFDSVTALDVAGPDDASPGRVTHRRVDLLVEDLVPHLAGATTLVHLASVFAPVSARAGAAAELELAERMLTAAAETGIDHLVLISSATVYGAWPENPIPITEEASLRPNPGFEFAEAKARIEALADRFRRDHPGATVSVLRPTAALAEDGTSWVVEALSGASGVRAGEVDPPVQFLHFDDLATAVVVVAEQGADGAFNVAPDGWIPPDAMRALAGTPRPRVPERVAARWASVRWRLGWAPTPPQVLPLTMHPWVVANDRLRALGWVPTHTSEEAYVTGTDPGPLDTLSPKRRQELAIGAVAGTAVAGGAVGVALVRRLWRRRR